MNPTIDFDNPSEGVYDIWVGSFIASDYIPGVLNISESTAAVPTSTNSSASSGSSNPSAALALDYTLTPNFGEIALQTGFTPDPFQFTMTSGGNLDVSSSLPNCNGYVTAAPDYTVAWSGNSTLLRFFFESNGDTILIINDANGNWQCNDDSFGTLNPTIDFDNPSEGIYNIWGGSFIGSDYVSGVLNITEASSVVPTSSASSNPSNPANPSNPPNPANPSNPSSVVGLDYALDANYGG
ncbi:MAG: hypothetical protein Q9P44_16465, partial [Anaerolineae bacterium]|nr:hypothetical protein [Anaerolineae bacterium]